MNRAFPRRSTPAPCALVVIGFGLLLLSGAGADEKAAGAEDAAALLAKLGFPPGSGQKVLSGAFIEEPLKSSSHRELSVALAFRVDLAPPELAERFDYALAIRRDPDTVAFGEIHGQGSEKDFQALHLHEKDARRWLNAKAGETLNLSSGEIEALRGLREGLDGSGSVVDAVGGAVRKILLERYRAYRNQGLAGIAPYQRGSGKARDAGGELRAASRAARAQEVFAPAFYSLLLDYPKNRPKGLEENFYWIHYKAHGERVLILTQWISVPQGGRFASVQRQFYVSRSYDVEQSLMALIPVSDGTLVAYTNGTFTDQVDGFGGAMRRSIGRKLMASQLRGLYKGIRKGLDEAK